MDTETMVRILSLIMILGLSIPSMTFGYLLVIRNKLELLPGVNESNFSNPKAYAKSVGYLLGLIGMFSGVVGIVWCAGFATISNMIVSFYILTIIAVPCLYIIHRNSNKPTNDS